MESNQIYLIQNKNPPQNQNKQENFNESVITTSTSSISVNNKKNLPFTKNNVKKKKLSDTHTTS